MEINGLSEIQRICEKSLFDGNMKASEFDAVELHVDLSIRYFLALQCNPKITWAEVRDNPERYPNLREIIRSGIDNAENVEDEEGWSGENVDLTTNGLEIVSERKSEAALAEPWKGVIK